MVDFDYFRATVFFVALLTFFFAVDFAAVGFLVLPALAAFLCGVDLDKDFRATVFFVALLIACPTTILPP